MRNLRRRYVVMLAAVAAALAGSPLAPAAAAPHLQPGPPQAGVAAAGSDWPQFGFSAARTSDNPFETVLGPGNVAGLRQKWSFLAGDRVESSPAVVAGVVYFTSIDRHLFAVNAATGAQLWSFGFANAFFTDPAVAGRIIYAGSVDGRLYAVNAATGAQLRSFATPGQANTTPAVAGGVVYVESEFGAAQPGVGDAVYALDAATGAMLWSFATSGRPAGVAGTTGSSTRSRWMTTACGAARTRSAPPPARCCGILPAPARCPPPRSRTGSCTPASRAAPLGPVCWP